MSYDFGGYVTKNDITCTDGRIIRHGAFADCDGKRVPLVWQHVHDSIDNVLGHVDLSVRDDGVYGFASLNETPSGKKAREVIKHSDVASLSIYANQLKQRGPEVIHGVIREVSLVLAGANSGATIDNLSFAHADGSLEAIEEEAILSMWEPIVHADNKEDEKPSADDAASDSSDRAAEEEPSAEEGGQTVQDVFDSMSDDMKAAIYAVIAKAVDAVGLNASTGTETVAHADDDQQAEIEDEAVEEAFSPEEIQNAFDSMSEEQRNVAYYVIAKALEEAGVSEADLKKLQNQNGSENTEEENPEDVEHSGIYGEGEGRMGRHNVFESAQNAAPTFSQDELDSIFHAAQTSGNGSLKDAVLAHGITSVDVLFPEAQAVSAEPALISRRMEWVDGVLSAVHKSPFSRVKGTAINITADEARARGYIKNNKKVEEQVSALKRVTTPQTIYKLQKLDRDDILDITDFDVVAWMKNEMRIMLNEEIARAILVGDGRDAGSNDKIKEDNIRPIWSDVDTYAVHSTVDTDTITDPKDQAKAFIEAAIRARKDYKGSGTPTLYVGVDLLTEMRLLRDELGYRLYKTDQELADELRVSKIVEIEQFSGLTRKDSQENTLTFGGIIVNLADYNVGSDRGGEVTLFDDFDLNYNKQEYLIETRMSGALVQPASALVIDFFAKKAD